MLRPLPDDVIDALVVQALQTPGKQAQDVIRALVRLVELEIWMRGQKREKGRNAGAVAEIAETS